MDHRCKLSWCLKHGKFHVYKCPYTQRWHVLGNEDVFRSSFKSHVEAINYAQEEARE